MTFEGDSFPENVIHLSTFKVEYAKEKHCECYRHSYPKKPPRFILDYNNREITCKHCGNKVDPIDAFEILANEQENWQRELDQAHEEAMQIKNYKPWLKAIKSIEQRCGGGKRIPACPHCQKGIMLEELAAANYVDKTREIEIRRFGKEGK